MEVPHKNKIIDCNKYFINPMISDAFPKLKLDKISLKNPIISITGLPHVENKESLYHVGKSVSNYPIINHIRQGEPNADAYRLEVFDKVITACVADGVGFGTKGKKAAGIATECFIKHFVKNITSLKTFDELHSELLLALASSQISIVASENNIYESGTTTFIGCVCTKITGGDWMLAGVSIGDCFGLIWNTKEKKLKKLNTRKRSCLSRGASSSGRLGSVLKDAAPDCGNLELFWTPCDQDDIVILLSNGVHDNFDPEVLGMPPSTFNLNANSWEESGEDEANKAKTDYIIESIQKFVYQSGVLLHPKEIAEQLINYTTALTNPIRLSYENNPNCCSTHKYSELPGYTDHTTCLVFQVGKNP